MNEALLAHHSVEITYHRSVGGATRIFLAGLARQEIWGSRDAAGTVSVPPADWDPETGRPAEGFVRVSERGTVRSWSWIPDPPPDHPAGGPFALALVQLDGADTALLHIVKVDSPAQIQTGTRVRASWSEERLGSILDLRAFLPEPDNARTARDRPAEPDSVDDVTVDSTPHLRYAYRPGLVLSGFLRGLGEGRIEGGRCPSCSGVYVPPRPRCPVCLIGPLRPELLPGRGTVASYTVVHLPFHGLTLDLPFVCAWIRLDGADTPFAHLMGEVRPEDVTLGMKVEAMWLPPERRGPTWESISYFRPLAP